MPEAAIPLVAEEAVGATAAEIAAEQAAAAAAAEAAAQAAAVEAAQQAAAQQAAEQATTQAAAQTAQTAAPTGLEQLLNPSTAAAPPAAPVQTAPIQPAFTPPPAAQAAVAPPAPVAPTAPTAPPPEVIPRSVGPIDTTTSMANPGFDTAGFETQNGIDILAKEVGVMPGVQPTISAYGAGPIGSTLPTTFNPTAPGIDQLVQTNLSGMGSNIPFGGTPLYPQAVTAQTPVVQSAMNEVITPGGTPLYSQTVTPQTPVVQSAMNEVAGGQPTPFEYVNNTAYGSSLTGTPTTPPEAGGLQGLYNDFKAMPLKDKALTGLMASSAYEMLNRPKPYEPKKYKSTWNAGAYSGYQPVQPTPYTPNYAHGGLADLGGYSDGGRMLKGPGDGMSDDIPATIANKQPARLANEEFVVPADVVSHLGNGSSEAGAKVLYKMMDRVRQARTGNKKQGKQINPEKYLA